MKKVYNAKEVSITIDGKPLASAPHMIALEKVDEYTAPEGAVWVCQACGKESPHRVNGPPGASWDSSCFLWAVLCAKDSIKRDENGRLVQATIWKAIHEMEIEGEIVV